MGGQVGGADRDIGVAPAGMTVSAIARRTGLHRSAVAKYVARGIEPPAQMMLLTNSQEMSETAKSSVGLVRPTRISILSL
jgi:hypothetical protein